MAPPACEAESLPNRGRPPPYRAVLPSKVALPVLAGFLEKVSWLKPGPSRPSAVVPVKAEQRR